MLEMGIDDAGRGPVIGPMVLAGCIIDKEIESRFRKLGVKDSKELTPKRREFLTQKILENIKDYKIALAYPDEINKYQDSGINLNDIEAIKTAEIINKLNKGKEKIKVIIDCPSVSLVKWKNLLLTKIENLSNLEIACEHKADKKHISVSAASILAKSTREKEMQQLKEKYGDDLGSGYMSDSKTSKFLQNNLHKHKHSGIFRKNWSSWKKAKEKSEQTKLDF